MTRAERAALKRAVLGAWRLESSGRWIGYQGCQVRRNGEHFAALTAEGAPLITTRRGAARLFDQVEKALAAVEQHFLGAKP